MSFATKATEVTATRCPAPPTTHHQPPTAVRLECPMPKLTVEGYGTFDVAENKRLVLAIEQDAKVDILHACGGNARCTTCRVEFIDGEPSTMTAAEKERLEQRGLTGVRLSCQILCDHDMTRARDQPARRIGTAGSGTDAGGDNTAASGLDVSGSGRWRRRLDANTRPGRRRAGPSSGCQARPADGTPASMNAAEQIGPTAATIVSARSACNDGIRQPQI